MASLLEKPRFLGELPIFPNEAPKAGFRANPCSRPARRGHGVASCTFLGDTAVGTGAVAPPTRLELLAEFLQSHSDCNVKAVSPSARADQPVLHGHCSGCVAETPAFSFRGVHPRDKVMSRNTSACTSGPIPNARFSSSGGHYDFTVPHTRLTHDTLRIAQVRDPDDPSSDIWSSNWYHSSTDPTELA